MYITDDPIADFHRHDAERSKWLKSLPVCADCDNPIQDEYCYEFNGEYICESCLKDLHRKEVEECVS